MIQGNQQQSSIRSLEGYTLIEVLLSLFLLIAVAVPAISAFFLNNSSIRAQESLTAVWLLEQEVENLRIIPDETVFVKHRKIGDLEWVIQTESSGFPLIRYHLTATKNGKRVGEIYSYGFKKGTGGR